MFTAGLCGHVRVRAGQMRAQADELARQARQVRAALAGTAWLGAAGTAVVTELAAVADDLDGLAQQVRRSASLADQAADQAERGAQGGGAR